MASTSTVQQEEKYLVRNNTAGHVGIVKINRQGEEVGENIEPYGAAWMTEEEMIATSRAPRLPEDNPFAEHTLIGVDPETQARREYKIRPLTLEQDAERYVPQNDRYVPTVDAPKDAAPAAVQSPAVAPPAIAAPASSGSQAGSEAPPPAPPDSPQGRPVPAPRTSAAPPPAPQPQQVSGAQVVVGGQSDEAQSWTEPPVAPGQIISGSLGGDDSVAPAPESAPDPTNAPTVAERFVPTAAKAQAAPQTPGAVAEEHAAAVDPDVGEETGAAKPPVGPQPEGEFAQAEEVGSPAASQKPARPAKTTK